MMRFGAVLTAIVVLALAGCAATNGGNGVIASVTTPPQATYVDPTSAFPQTDNPAWKWLEDNDFRPYLHEVDHNFWEWAYVASGAADNVQTGYNLRFLHGDDVEQCV